MTKQQFVAGAPFVYYKESRGLTYYQFKADRSGGGVVSEFFAGMDRATYVCSIERVTDKNVHAFSCMLGKIGRVIVPLNGLYPRPEPLALPPAKTETPC